MSKQKKELLDALEEHSNKYLSVLSERVFYVQTLKIINHYLPGSTIFNMFDNDLKSFIKRRRKDNNIQLRWDARKERRTINNLISSSSTHTDTQPSHKKRRM